MSDYLSPEQAKNLGLEDTGTYLSPEAASALGLDDEEPQGMSAGRAATVGFAHGGTAGHTDEIAGGVNWLANHLVPDAIRKSPITKALSLGTPFQLITDAVPESDVKLGSNFNPSPDDTPEQTALKQKALGDQKSSYQVVRDTIRNQEDKAAEDQPLAYAGGDLGGAVALAYAGGKFIPGQAKGGGLLNTAKRLGQAGLEAAGYGAVAGEGDSRAEDLGGIAKDAGKGAALSAALGVAGQGAGEAIGAAGQYAGKQLQKLYGKAADTATDAFNSQIGARRKQIQEAVSGLHNALDAGHIDPKTFNAEIQRMILKYKITPQEVSDLIPRRFENIGRAIRDMYDNPKPVEALGVHIQRALEAQAQSSQSGLKKFVLPAIAAGIGYKLNGWQGALLGAGGVYGTGYVGRAAQAALQNPNTVRKLTSLAKWGPIIGQAAQRGGQSLGAVLFTISRHDPQAGAQIEQIIGQGEEAQ